MKAFISWSGQLSQSIAELLKTYIPAILQQVDIFVSSEDIEKGDNWNNAVRVALNECDQGIVCLTKENASKPWINFEAGALAKELGKKLQVLLIDSQVSDVSGPLSVFQTTKLEKQDFKKLIISLNNDLQEPLPDERLNLVFDAVWDQFDKSVKKALDDSIDYEDANVIETSKSDRDVIEEILRTNRRISVAVEGLAEQLPKTYSAVNNLLLGQKKTQRLNYNVFNITNSEQIKSAIAPYRIIRFKEGDFCTSDVYSIGPFVYTEDVFDGVQLVVSDVDHIIMIGDNTQITTKPRYAQVLKFKNCSNIALENITLGHLPDLGYCAGNVLEFQNCSNVFLNRLKLFGCGTYGIRLNNCRGFYIDDVDIYKCTYGALHYTDAECYMSNINIHDCNDSFSIMDIIDSSIIINNARIHDNHNVQRFMNAWNSQIIYKNLNVENNSFITHDDELKGISLD